MKKHVLTKAFSVLLSAAMLCTTLPTVASGAESEEAGFVAEESAELDKTDTGETDQNKISGEESGFTAEAFGFVSDETSEENGDGNSESTEFEDLNPASLEEVIQAEEKNDAGNPFEEETGETAQELTPLSASDYPSQPWEKLPELVLGENSNIKCNENDVTWYRLTATTSEIYTFTPAPEWMYVYENVLNEDGENCVGTHVSGSGDSAGYKDGWAHTMWYSLEAGKNYYIGLRGSITYADPAGKQFTDQTNMVIRKIPKVVSAQVKPGTLKAAYFGGIYITWITDPVFIIKYQNGTQGTISFLTDEYSVLDQYGHRYAVFYTDQKGEAISPGNILKKGKYKLVLRCDYEELLSADFAIGGPETLPKLKTGLNNGITIPQNSQRVFYQYTPDETGKYNVTYTETNCSIALYSQRSDGGYDFVQWLDLKNSNFVYELKGNKTYVVEISPGYNNSQTDGKKTWNILIEKQRKAVSMSASLESVEFYEKVEHAYLGDTVFSINYNNGSREKVTCKRNSGTFADQDQNTYAYSWVNVADKKETRYKAGSILTPGTYKMVISGKNGDIPMDKNYTIKVMALNAAMKVGLNKKVQTPKRKYAWYSFIPPQTGDYSWNRISQIKVIKAGSGTLNEVEAKGIGYKRFFHLEKGCEYYVGFKGGIWVGTDDSNGKQRFEFDMTLYKCDVVTSVILLQKNIIKEVYVEGAVYIPEDTGDILVTYADGHKEIVKETDNPSRREDSSGNEFRLYYRDSAGNIYVHYSHLKKGSYTAIVCCNGTVVNTTNAPAFKILPVTQASQGKLKEGVNKNIRSNGNWYTFTPKKTGKYGFYMDQEPDIYTLTKNGKLHWVSKRYSYSDERRLTKYPLQKGVTYYIQFHDGGFYRGVDSKGDAIMAEKGNVTIKIKDDCKKEHTINPYYDKVIKKATCNKKGTKKSFCVDCGKTFTKTIPATKKHKAGAWKVTKKATTTSTGLKVQKCVNCGKELATEKIPKLPSKKITTKKITGLKEKVTVKKGSRLALKPVLAPADSQEKITYSSSNEKIATVSAKGIITGKKKGTVTITVKSGKVSEKVKVTVK